MKRGWKPRSAASALRSTLRSQLQSIPQWKEDGNIVFSLLFAMTIHRCYNQYLNEKRMETNRSCSGPFPSRIFSLQSIPQWKEDGNAIRAVCIHQILQAELLQSIPQWKEDGNWLVCMCMWSYVWAMLQSIPQWKEDGNANAIEGVIAFSTSLQSIPQWKEDGNMKMK